LRNYHDDRSNRHQRFFCPRGACCETIDAAVGIPAHPTKSAFSRRFEQISPASGASNEATPRNDQHVCSESRLRRTVRQADRIWPWRRPRFGAFVAIVHAPASIAITPQSGEDR